MHRLLSSPFAAAVLGGGVTAGALLGSGVVADGPSTTVIQQAPLSVSTAGSRTIGSDTAMTARDIYRRDAPGVVFIRAQVVSPAESPFDVYGGGQESESTGSGFVIDDDGHIVTNAHVVNAATQVRVTFSDKRTRSAKIVGKDESTDLAVLKVDPDDLDLDLRPLALGDSDQVEVGDPTVAIGNPFGFDRTLTTGVVSAKQRFITAPDGYTIENVIQTDAAINPGNSGGPLLDAAGRVIGINSQIATGGAGSGSVGIGFAVPVNTAKRIVKQLKEDGRVERPWLGLDYVPIDGALSSLDLEAKFGALVQRVVNGGPAARAGIRGGREGVAVDGARVLVGGDVIQRIGGRPIRATEDVRLALDAKRPGDTVSVELLRGDERLSVEVRLGDRPAGRPVE